MDINSRHRIMEEFKSLIEYMSNLGKSKISNLSFFREEISNDRLVRKINENLQIAAFYKENKLKYIKYLYDKYRYINGSNCKITKKSNTLKLEIRRGDQDSVYIITPEEDTWIEYLNLGKLRYGEHVKLNDYYNINNIKRIISSNPHIISSKCFLLKTHNLKVVMTNNKYIEIILNCEELDFLYKNVERDI